MNHEIIYLSFNRHTGKHLHFSYVSIVKIWSTFNIFNFFTCVFFLSLPLIWVTIWSYWEWHIMTNDKPKKQQKRFITMIVALRLYVLPNPWMNRFVSKMSSANTSILHIQSLFAFTCFSTFTTICYPKHVA